MIVEREEKAVLNVALNCGTHILWVRAWGQPFPTVYVCPAGSFLQQTHKSLMEKYVKVKKSACG